MTIEFHNPELEVILEQRRKAGNFGSVEDMLLQTLRSAPEPPPIRTRQVLIDVCAEVRGLRSDGDMDALFTRNRSLSRPVDLS